MPVEESDTPFAERFVQVWQESDSAVEAAGKLGIKSRSASTMAYNYRRMGVPLKLMRRGNRKINVERLCELAGTTPDMGSAGEQDTVQE